MQTITKAADRETPEPLALILAVVNTRYGRTRADDWHSPEQVREWLLHHRLLASEIAVSQGDQRRLIEVREALRGLLRGNNGVAVASEHIETLNHMAKHASLIVRLRPDGTARLVPDIEGVDGVIGLLLGIVYTAMA